MCKNRKLKIHLKDHKTKKKSFFSYLYVIVEKKTKIFVFFKKMIRSLLRQIAIVRIRMTSLVRTDLCHRIISHSTAYIALYKNLLKKKKKKQLLPKF